jgi:hypothetical protein
VCDDEEEENVEDFSLFHQKAKRKKKIKKREQSKTINAFRPFCSDTGSWSCGRGLFPFCLFGRRRRCCTTSQEGVEQINTGNSQQQPKNTSTRTKESEAKAKVNFPFLKK